MYWLKKHKWLLIISFLEFVFITYYGMIWFTYPIFLEGITSNITSIGLILALPPLVSVMTAIIMGRISDNIGRKPLLLLGSILTIILGFSTQYLSTTTNFILYCLVFGLVIILYQSSIKAYILDIAPKGKSGEYFGILYTFYGLGLTLGAFLGGYLLRDRVVLGLRNVGETTIVIGILSFIIALTLRETVSKNKSTENKINFIEGVKEYRRLGRTGLVVLYAIFIIAFGSSLVITLEPLFYTEGIDSTTVGLIMTLFVFPMILFSVPAGYLADRYGKKNVLIIGTISGGLFILLFGLARTTSEMMIMGFAATIGYAFVYTAANSLLADISKDMHKGSISGIINFAEDSGYIIAPVIGGILSDTYANFHSPFIIYGIILILSALFYTLIKEDAKIFNSEFN